MNSRKSPMQISKARKLSDVIIAHLKSKLKGALIEVCGSVRRRCPIVNDIDIAVAHPASVKVVDAMGSFPGVVPVNKSAATALTYMVDGVQINLYLTKADSFGAMTLFLTGSKVFNIIIRGQAKKQGYKLNQYGLWLGDEIIAGKTEKQIFFALGLEYVDPINREVTNKGNKAKTQPKKIRQERST